MFNVKISLLYFLLIALSVVAIVVIVEYEKEDALIQAEAGMVRAPAAFYAHTQLREQQMRRFASRLAGSELKANVQTLLDYRDDFIEVDKYICDETTGVPCGFPIEYDKVRSEKAEAAWGQNTFKPFSEDLMKRVEAYHPGWTEVEKKTFTDDARRRLKVCFALASKRCDWRFTYDALGASFGALKEDLVKEGTPELIPDVVLVFDAMGKGIASAEDAGWSDKEDHISIVNRLKRYAASWGMRGTPPVYYDLMELRESKHMVAMVPMSNEKGRFIGAVLVGYSISGKMVQADKKIFDREVTYLLGESPVASTMKTDDAKFLQASVPVADRLKKHVVRNDGYIAISMPYYPNSSRAIKANGTPAPPFVHGAAYGQDYTKLRVALATPKELWVASYAKMQVLVPVFGLGIFIVGVILIWLLIRNHTRPFEKIDIGLHEVINGNFDYQFPFDYKEDLPSSMAQSLNLMIAVLLGKPLPEDEAEATGGWDSGVTAASGARSRPRSGDGDLIIAQAPGAPPSADMMSEPAEAYYKRLYAEYRKARAAAGAPDDVITYVRFVEQLVRSERDLKQKLSAKHVRFTVNQQGSKVVLVPIPLR